MLHEPNKRHEADVPRDSIEQAEDSGDRGSGRRGQWTAWAARRVDGPLGVQWRELECGPECRFERGPEGDAAAKAAVETGTPAERADGVRPADAEHGAPPATRTGARDTAAPRAAAVARADGHTAATAAAHRGREATEPEQTAAGAA